MTILSLLRTRPPFTRNSATHPSPRNTRHTRQSMLTRSETKGGFEGRKSETAKFRTKGGRARYIESTLKVPPSQKKLHIRRRLASDPLLEAAA